MKRLLPSILAIVIFCVIFVAYRALNPARPLAFENLSPAEQQNRRASAQKLVEKIDGIAKNAKTGAKTDFDLQILANDLNTLMQDRISGKNLPIHDLSVSLEPGYIVLNGSGDYKGFSAPVAMRGTLQAQNGGAEFNMESITVAGLPAPSDWKTKAEKAIDGAFQSMVRRENGVRVDSIQIEQDKINIKGQTGS